MPLYARQVFRNHFGKVTSDLHAKGKNATVSNSFTYGYKIKIDGKIYRGDSNIRGLVIGQQIEVEYLPSFPYFHRYSRKKEAD